MKGKIKATTSHLVIFEIIWVLHSYYELSREEIVERVSALLGLEGLEISQKALFLEALILWQESKVDFNDVFSYGKHFDKFPEIKRIEP